ncbi:hypothetical protein B7494_g6716 [Chlorociboria aeruginascens]|nr:hypothetical protein B7494_g6716 [Chlorociboria aeruginascens]
MRPEKVSSWREQLPPPFNKPSPIIRRRASVDNSTISGDALENGNLVTRKRRRNSTYGALDRTDRKVNWLRFIHDQHGKRRCEDSSSAVEKLRRIKRWKSQHIASSQDSSETLSDISHYKNLRKPSVAPKIIPSEPTRDEIFALAAECFPRIEESRVIIIEYSQNSFRASEFTLEEVLASEHILQPGDIIDRVRWIYVEYYKIGCFWGSDVRFSQWGTDPALFEKSPIVLLQARLAELDRKAGRAPLHEEDMPGHKKIGKYYRQTPGCPEYLGLRANPSQWLKSEPYELLMDYVNGRPSLLKELQRVGQNDLGYGLCYIDAVRFLRNAAYQARPGLREIHQYADNEEVYAYGSWDDHVERLEFYREHTLLSCGSPRLFKIVADRLLRKEDPMRQHPDCALLYYTLARVSIENDEMMQDTPERALNKIFSGLKNHLAVDRKHVEVMFNLQQAVLDGLEYLEENQRELPIWGIPPFGNHHVNFHPDHTPTKAISHLIQREMDLVDKDFSSIIHHWRALKSKVDRHLDVLLQFRVLEQQELAIEQRNMATQQQSMAVEEAKRSGVQARSILVFTALTIIFLPLSFFTSYFGMNLPDISEINSKVFWTISGPISVGIIIIVFVLMRVASTVQEHDEEWGMKIKDEIEVVSSWRSRLKLRAGKLKLV